MDELLTILRDIIPDADLDTCDTLVDDGFLDSFAIVTLIAQMSDAFDVTIPAGEIVPENFNSASALWAMLERLLDE